MPGVVPVLAPVVVPLLFTTMPPQPMAPPARAKSSTTAPSRLCQRRRRVGMPKSSRQARAAPPDAYQGADGPGMRGRVTAADAGGAVVVMVSVAVVAPLPLRLATAVEPKLKEGGSCAAMGISAI